MPPTAPDARLAALWPAVSVMAELFRHDPDTAFFVKDAAGRYALCNQSLAERCGLRSPDELVGRRVRDIFPAELGGRYAAQDEQILRTGRPVIDRLELHWYSRRRTGWCLTTKLPLRDAAGSIVGLIGLSRDLRALKDSGQIPRRAARRDGASRLVFSRTPLGHTAREESGTRARAIRASHQAHLSTHTFAAHRATAARGGLAAFAGDGSLGGGHRAGLRVL